MVKFWTLMGLAVLIGIVGGTLSYNEKRKGVFSYAGIAVIAVLMWLMVSLLFWWFLNKWLLIPISIVFVIVLILSIVKCIRAK